MILGYASIGLAIGAVLVFMVARSLPAWAFYIGAYVVGAALLLSTTLASTQLIGSDVHVEYYYAFQSLQNGWDTSLPSTINTSTAITVMAPMLAKMGIPLKEVFRVVYPLLFALVPVLLVYIYSRFMDIKWAFLAAFVFMLVPTFFLEMPQVTRQMIAELLVVGMLALLMSNLDHKWKMLGLLAGSILVVLSHYTIATFWFVILAATVYGYLISNQKWRTLDVAVVLGISGIFALVYSQWASSGWQGEDFGNALQRLSWPNPKDYLITIPATLILVYGFYRLMKYSEAPKLYQSWALTAGVLLLLGALYPPFSNIINFSRYYHLMLIFLAPCILYSFPSLKIAVPALVVAFVVTSGLLFNLLRINNIERLSLPYSIALENRRLDAGNYLTDSDSKVAEWASENGVKTIYGDMGAKSISQDYLSIFQTLPIERSQSGDYLLLRSWNTERGTAAVYSGVGLREQIPLNLDYLNKNIVYQFGDSKLVKIQ